MERSSPAAAHSSSEDTHTFPEMENRAHEPSHSDNKAMFPSTNNDGVALPERMKRSSLSSAIETPLPPSSPVAQRIIAANDNENPISFPGLNTPAKTPLRRAPSATSIASSERSTTPSLRKKTSLSSLQSAGGATPPRSPAIRRTSSQFAPSPNATLGARSSLLPPAEEPSRPPMTAASVAHDFFEKELGCHVTGTDGMDEIQTVVILHDDCYGHRYSRPRTSRANLSTIVERPERIHASILGLATAYVRLGGRYGEGPAAPHPKKHPTSLPPAAFRIQKTARRLSLESPAATGIHGAQWMGELSNMCNAAESKLALGGKELTRPYPQGQQNGTSGVEMAKLHEGDLYLCSGSLDALEGALGGVCEGVDAVFQEQGPKRAFVCIRPPGHHCSANMPSGFCWLNNVHVGINHAIVIHGLTHAAIIDFDLHHGDGSQSITWAHNARVISMPRNTPMSKKTAIGYFSVHDINSYPCEMGDEEKVRNASLCIENAHGQNIWNVHLESWKTEAEFWRLYEQKYSVILTKARSFLRLHSEKLRQAPTHPKPKAAIFLSAGFDASEWESPGMQRHQVNVPTSFYARLTRDVAAIAGEEGLGVDGRVISVLEGGYSDRALTSGVLSHISGLAVGARPIAQASISNRLDSKMIQRLGRLELNGDGGHGPANGAEEAHEAFDPDWWSMQRLEEVETLINPPAPVAPKKQRSEIRPTYSSATQSYTAKIVSPPQARRSFSGAGASLHQSPTSRPPSPPAPTVDWATAAYELSKLLVPSDRESRSCKPEDLNAEASRIRRDRYSTVGLPESTSTTVPAHVADAKRMQLRDRRGKTPQYVSEDEEVKPPSRANRRKTIADVSLLPEDPQLPTEPLVPLEPSVPRHARRRSSVASHASSTIAEKGSNFSLGSATDAHPKREPLVVKKSRAPANHRTETTKPKAVKKQPPVPPFPSTASKTLVSENPQAAVASNQEREKAPVFVQTKSQDNDVEQLASGMRTMSIKLNVPSREEYEARQSRPKVAPKGRPPKPVANKGASPTKAKVKAVKNPSPPISLPTEPLPVQQLPPPAIAAVPVPEMAVALPPPSALPLQPAASEVPVNVSSPKLSLQDSSSIPSNSTMNTCKADSAIAHHEDVIQEEMPKRYSQAGAAPYQQSPENTYPTTPFTTKRTKQDLPVFTSTSPISFGKSNVTSSSIEQTMNQEHRHPSNASQSIQLPIVEQLATTDSALSQGTLLAPDHSVDKSSVEKSSKLESESKPSPSIWDVPDTPQPRKP